jgi:hypothetical protein
MMAHRSRVLEARRNPYPTTTRPQITATKARRAQTSKIAPAALTETLTLLTRDETPVESPSRTSFSVTPASGATY